MLRGCIGAADGTHIHAHTADSDAVRFHSRKGEISHNALGYVHLMSCSACCQDGKGHHTIEVDGAKQMGQLRETIAEDMWRDYNLYLERQKIENIHPPTPNQHSPHPDSPPRIRPLRIVDVDRETARSMMVCLHVGGARSL
jgi:hypothetical protein